jgi:hypothetical protein
MKRKRLGKVNVTFVQAYRDEALFVTGDFNDWQREPLKKAKDGTMPGDTLAFRYVTASDEWFDDEAADAYVHNEHGTTNGVVKV